MNCGAKLDVFMSALIILLVGCCCDAFDDIDIEVSNDLNYPRDITISRLRYKPISGKMLEVSCDIDIAEDISHGTKVSKR